MKLPDEVTEECFNKLDLRYRYDLGRARRFVKVKDGSVMIIEPKVSDIGEYIIKKQLVDKIGRTRKTAEINLKVQGIEVIKNEKPMKSENFTEEI